MDNKTAGVPKPGMPGKQSAQNPQQTASQKGRQQGKLKELAMKISQMDPQQQKKAINELAQKNKQVAKQVAQMVQQVDKAQQENQKDQGAQPSQARMEQRKEFEQETSFEEGGELPEYEEGGEVSEYEEGGDTDNENTGLSDDQLKKIGAVSQIAPDIFGLAQSSGETDYIPRISNEGGDESLSTMDEAIESMPDEYNIRAAEQRNESSYQQASDAMYRNTSSGPVARANVGRLFGKKMEASNKLNGVKNNKEAQYAQAEAQLLTNKAQMQSQLGSEDAKYESAYQRNKLKADAKRRALRQKYLANIGSKIGTATKGELSSRRDKDAINIYADSHTGDVSEKVRNEIIMEYLNPSKK